jgi:hypothetical protein
MRGDIPRGGKNILQIRVIIPFARGGTHGNKDRIGLSYARGGLCGEGQTSCFLIEMDKILQSRFVNGNVPRHQSVNLSRIVVYTGNPQAKLCETHPRDKAHITRSNNNDVHKGFL